MSNETAIKISGLSKKYRLQHPVRSSTGDLTHELWVLKNIDLEIKKGEHIGIIGPNGSGKSTLLKILAGVTKPSAGSVEIDGKVAGILDIGAGFHPELTGRENVFLSGQLLGFSKKYIAGRLNEIIDFSGIEKFIDEPVKNYSAGMYLRLAFSVIMQVEADIYLFDEAMSVGDEEFRQKSYKRIQEKISSGATTITVSHEMALLTSGTTKILQFPSLVPYYPPSTFDLDQLNPHHIKESVVVDYLHVMKEKNRWGIEVGISGLSNSEKPDLILLFHKMNSPGEFFAISSMHPLSMNTGNSKIPGTTIFKTYLAQHTINPGMYLGSLHVVLEKSRLVKFFKNYFELNIPSSTNVPDRFFDAYPGSVRLQTDWEIQY